MITLISAPRPAARLPLSLVLILVCLATGMFGSGRAQGLADLLDRQDAAVRGENGRTAVNLAPGRRPVPSAAALRDAVKKIRDVFMADAKSAATPEAKTSLAGQLLGVVGEEPDPATRYALMQAAAKLATDAGSVELATRAIMQIGSEFEVNGDSLLREAYGEMVESAPSDALGPVVDKLLDAAATAMTRENFDDAESLIKRAVTGARRGKDRGKQALAVQALNDLRSRRKTAERLRPFLDRLKQEPTDQGAASAVGKQWCFEEGRWEEGLPYLARSGEPALAAAASAELQAKSDGQAILDAAVLWENVLKAAPKAEKQSIGQHVAELYIAALPGLTGLAKVEAEKAIDEIQASLPKTALEAGWQVIFRSSDASIWDTDTREGLNRFAVKLSEVPGTITFLRMRSSDGGCVIIPMSKVGLGRSIRGSNYTWTGHKQVTYGATLLGVGDRQANIMGKPGVPVAVRTGEWLTGYGFGPNSSAGNVPTPVWANKPAPGVTIEISVGSRPLLPEERRSLLDMGDIEP